MKYTLYLIDVNGNKFRFGSLTDIDDKTIKHLKETYGYLIEPATDSDGNISNSKED